MKKTFFLLIISLISLNLFAEGKITYNKNIKNPKNFVIDNLDIFEVLNKHFKITEDGMWVI